LFLLFAEFLQHTGKVTHSESPLVLSRREFETIQ
jgi:hypothetical protein